MHALRISVVLLAAFAVACSHAKPEPTPAEQQPVAQAAPAPAPAPVQPAPEPAPPVVTPPPTNVAASIYFAFDKADLSTESRNTLSRLYGPAAASGTTVRIEGNCDERGSAEYNIGLGQRRADAAKGYLVRLGVPAANITTVSYGKERPKAPGHDEASWQENRRDDIFVSGPRAVSAR